jgi:hypothetical protein
LNRAQVLVDVVRFHSKWREMSDADKQRRVGFSGGLAWKYPRLHTCLMRDRSLVGYLPSEVLIDWIPLGRFRFDREVALAVLPKLAEEFAFDSSCATFEEFLTKRIESNANLVRAPKTSHVNMPAAVSSQSLEARA